MLRVGGLGRGRADARRLVRAQPSRGQSRRRAGRATCRASSSGSTAGPATSRPSTPSPTRPTPFAARTAPSRPTSPACRSASCCRCWRGTWTSALLIRSMSHNIDAHSPIPMLTGLAERDDARTARSSRSMHGFRGECRRTCTSARASPRRRRPARAAVRPVEIADPTGNARRAAAVLARRRHQRRPLRPAPRAARRRRPHARRRPGQRAVEQHGPDLPAGRRYPHVDRRCATRSTWPASSDELRDRYGANFFGQSCLLARRLVEAGTRFVQVKWYDGTAFDAWDVHGADLGGMVRMEQQLCPRLDQGLSALLEDLDERGLLRIDAGRGRRRVRPHAADQPLRRPRPLPALLLVPAGRRRRARRRGRRRQRPHRRPPDAPPGRPRRVRRHALPPARHRHQRRPARAAVRPRRATGVGAGGLGDYEVVVAVLASGGRQPAEGVTSSPQRADARRSP